MHILKQHKGCLSAGPIQVVSPTPALRRRCCFTNFREWIILWMSYKNRTPAAMNHEPVPLKTSHDCESCMTGWTLFMWRGNRQNKMLLITCTMSHQDYYKTIWRREFSPPTREEQRHKFSIFAWFTYIIQWFISTEQRHTFLLLWSWPLVSGAPLKGNAPAHWPSASLRDSRDRDECLWGRGCCGGWSGSASQCSMSEEGGSRWPYMVPALGGSRGGKKYLNQQDDRHTDGEETIEYEGKHITGSKKNNRLNRERRMLQTGDKAQLSLKEISQQQTGLNQREWGKKTNMQFMCAHALTHAWNELADRSKLADEEEALVICRLLVYLWRGQLPLGRDKGGSLAIPACNKQHNRTLFIKNKKYIESTQIWRYFLCNVNLLSV